MGGPTGPRSSGHGRYAPWPSSVKADGPVKTIGRTSLLSEGNGIRGTIGVDIDPIDVHMAGYGLTSLTRDTTVYDVAVPRLLDLFARHGIRATFFVLGRDAEAQSPLLRRIIAAGHEIADHSMTHPAALGAAAG